MKYYRLALQDHQTARWAWKTTALTSLPAVFQLLRSHWTFPQDRVRVFISSSKEELYELLNRENNGQASGSLTAAQFLQERNIRVPESVQSRSEQSSVAQVARQGANSVASSTLRQSLAATGLPSSLGMSLLDKKRLEIELGSGGDHDTLYRFALPVSTPQLLAWARLQARAHAGEVLS